MRIAIDCSHHAVPGGIRTVLDNLVPALTRVAPEDDFVLYTRGRHGHGTVVPGTERARAVHVKMPRRVLARLENHLGWPRLERWTGPVDVVHATHFAMPACAATARRILNVYDVTYLRHPELYRDRRLNDYGYRYLLGHALRRAERILTISHTSKRDLVELCGVLADKIWVVPCGIDPRFRASSADAGARLVAQLGLEAPFALYPVGTLEARKNISRALEAFARAFPDANERPQLVLTGVGEPPAAFLRNVVYLGLRRHVRLVQVGHPEDLAALMSSAAWGMYPSLYEGFGLPVLEGMACGLPLLVSDRASCPEVAGDAALLVDPGDTDALAAGMARLHDDAVLRDELARRGPARAHGAGFSWERAAHQTLAAYRDDVDAYLAQPMPLEEPAARAASVG